MTHDFSKKAAAAQKHSPNVRVPVVPLLDGIQSWYKNLGPVQGTSTSTDGNTPQTTIPQLTIINPESDHNFGTEGRKDKINVVFKIYRKFAIR